LSVLLVVAASISSSPSKLHFGSEIDISEISKTSVEFHDRSKATNNKLTSWFCSTRNVVFATSKPAAVAYKKNRGGHHDPS
jgi:hypothetical protein